MLKVLTFNTWLLKTPVGVSIASDVESRLKLIPQKIKNLDPDIVSLQEVWHPKHRSQLILELGKLGYPYYALRCETAADWSPLNWIRASLGNGLLIFSKFPMHEKVQQLRFSQHTRADERATVKGAIRVEIQIPGIGAIDFYNAHLGAVSFDAKRAEYDPVHLAANLAQVRELTKFMQQHSGMEKTVVAALDLDAHYQVYERGKYIDALTANYAALASPEHGIGLEDTYRKVHGMGEEPHWTFDRANPYVANGHFSHAPSEVVDYIFLRNNKKLVTLGSERVLTDALTAEECQAVGAENTPARLSDHYGILTTFAKR